LERVVFNYDKETGTHSKKWVEFRSTDDVHFMDRCLYDCTSNEMVHVDEYTGKYMEEIRTNQPPPSPTDNGDDGPR
jgi:hypothetical protein